MLQFRNLLKNTFKADDNISGKIISRILQIVENDLLEFYFDFFNDQGLLSLTC